MHALTETVINFFELAEAEGRLLQRKVMQTSFLVMLVIMAVLLLVVAGCLFLMALYQWLSVYWATYQVLSIIGLVCLTVAGGILWQIKQYLIRPTLALKP